MSRPAGKKASSKTSEWSLTDYKSNPRRPFFADTYGRKTPIIIGCVVETIGAFIGAFSNGYASMALLLSETGKAEGEKG